MTQRVGVALSGGADSAVAASLLLSQGYQVLGTHLLMTHSPQAHLQARHAQHIAARLGIPCEIVDVAETFKARVVTPFCREYAAGRTPNPCVICNREVKFGLLLQSILERGADLMATGHYVRIGMDGEHHVLHKAADHRADQSYFLYAIPPRSLPHLVMPLGNLSRREVRSLASQQALEPARSSQDICFVGGDDYRSFVASRVTASPGDIVDTQEVVRGRHRGLPYYTVGQRHGLGIALGEPKYVVRLDAESNRVVVGGADALLTRTALLRQMNWLREPPADGYFAARAKTRYRARCTAARVSLRPDGTLVYFEQPQRAVAPGQSIVFYDGDSVIGGGIIAESHRETADAEADSWTQRG